MPIIKRLIHFLTPDACIRCGIEGGIVCQICLPKIANNKSSTCFLCNRQTREFATCRTCKRKTAVSRVYVGGYYEEYVKELITRLKYNNAVAAVEPLAETVIPFIDTKYDLIVPIPSSARRFRQRGYNQAVLLGKAIGRQLDTPCSEVLGRFGHSRQVGADRRERLTQLKGMFYIRKSSLIHGQRVLLVDDVVTTGTTINECATALKTAGARSVSAAVIAKH